MLIASVDGGSPSNGLAIAALAVALLSLVIAASALGWQIAAWLLEAGRARVQLRLGAFSSTGAGLVTHAVDSKLDPDKAIRDLMSQGYTAPVLAVSVTSIGRAPVTVQSWSAHAAKIGISFMPLADLIGDPLPKRLEPGETYTWAAPLQSATALVDAGQVVRDTGGVDDVYVVVELGSGKKLRTPTSLSVRA